MNKKNINKIILLWKDYSVLIDEDYVINKQDLEIQPSIFRIGNEYSFMVDISTNKILSLSNDFYKIHDTNEEPFYLSDLLSLIHPDDLAFVRFSENWGLENILGFKEKNTYKIGYVVRMKGENNTYELFYHQTYYEFNSKGKIKFCIMMNTKFKHFKAPLKYLVGILNINTNEFESYVRYDSLTNEMSKILSKRQMDIVKELVNGLTDKEIAEKLFISYNTARTHRRDIYKKLGARNNAELIKIMIEFGIV